MKWLVQGDEARLLAVHLVLYIYIHTVRGKKNKKKTQTHTDEIQILPAVKGHKPV